MSLTNFFNRITVHGVSLKKPVYVLFLALGEPATKDLLDCIEA